MKNYIFLLIVAVAVYIYVQKKDKKEGAKSPNEKKPLTIKAPNTMDYKETLQEVHDIAKKEYGADKAQWIVSQILHETGAKMSPLAKLNNLTGITYAKQKFAIDSGIALPENKKVTYARYSSLADWFADYSRIVNKSLTSSNTLFEYIQALKKQGYFTASLDEYRNAVGYFMRKILSYVDVAK